MAPLVVHEKEEGEDGDDEARDDEHHHHQPAVHVLLLHLQSLGRSYITAECWPMTVEISIQSCWGFYKMINKNHLQQYIFSKDRLSVILQSIEQEEETFNLQLVL